MATQKGKKATTKKTEIITFKDKLKKEYSDVYEIILEAGEIGETYTSYFRKPSITELGIYFSELAKNQTDIVTPQELLLKTIFVGGHDDFFEDGILLLEVVEQLQFLITGYPIEIEKIAINNRLCFEIKILDDEGIEPTFTVKRPSVKDLSEYYSQAESNILTATKTLLKNLWVEGDKQLLENDKYFLSAMSSVERIMERRVAKLEKL